MIFGMKYWILNDFDGAKARMSMNPIFHQLFKEGWHERRQLLGCSIVSFYTDTLTP